jgi:hypothetical protein|tara:strand:- start:7656 stop:7853 length:198 start_codon:yes stop_codon:yes gene_type:complete
MIALTIEEWPTYILADPDYDGGHRSRELLDNIQSGLVQLHQALQGARASGPLEIDHTAGKIGIGA